MLLVNLIAIFYNVLSIFYKFEYHCKEVIKSLYIVFSSFYFVVDTLYEHESYVGRNIMT